MKETFHFVDMLRERGIDRKWVDATLNNPDRTEDLSDGTRHYIKQIAEFDNRWLRIIVNTELEPNKCVTAFFDRRLRRMQ